MTERYKYINGASVFPARNFHLLKSEASSSMHGAMVNIWAPITIEKDVYFGHSVMLLTGGHKINQDGVQAEVVARGEITIKQKAWIGSGSIILGGVTIGRSSIVASGSVVTKSIPDFEIWAGNPAKILRRLKENDLS